MRLVGNVLKPHIFNRLVVAFLLLVTPLYTVSLIMNSMGAGSVKNEIIQSTDRHVQSFLSELEEEIQLTITSQRELSANMDYINLSVRNDSISNYEKIRMMQSLLDKLMAIQATGNFTKNFSLYLPSIDRKLSIHTIIDQLDYGIYSELQEMAKANNGSFLYWQGRLISPIVYPAYGSEPAMLSMSTIELDQTSISRTLGSITENFVDGRALLMNDTWDISSMADDGDIPSLRKLLNNNTMSESVNLRGQSYFVISKYSPILNAHLLVLLPEREVFGPLLQYRFWFWLIVIISIVIILLFSYSIYRLIHRPLLQLVASFRRVEKGELNVMIEHNRRDEFHYLYEQFNRMVHQLKVSLQEIYEQQIRTQRAELKQLQSQINPHFLYNSFFILNEMVQKYDDDRLKQYTKHLGQYFHFITRDMADFVPLATEVQHARAYTSIQSLRFAKRIQVYFEEIPQKYEEIMVPRMILQPIVENSFEHGLDQVLSNGRLHVRFEAEDPLQLSIVVEDSGNQLSDAKIEEINRLVRNGKMSEHTGLLNVHRRIQLVYGENAGLTFQRSRLEGLLTKIVIPIRRDPHDSKDTGGGR